MNTNQILHDALSIAYTVFQSLRAYSTYVQDNQVRHETEKEMLRKVIDHLVAYYNSHYCEDDEEQLDDEDDDPINAS